MDEVFSRKFCHVNIALIFQILSNRWRFYNAKCYRSGLVFKRTKTGPAKNYDKPNRGIVNTPLLFTLRSLPLHNYKHTLEYPFILTHQSNIISTTYHTACPWLIIIIDDNVTKIEIIPRVYAFYYLIAGVVCDFRSWLQYCVAMSLLNNVSNL